MSQAKRTIRLFVSSTFGDMKKERDVLQREVFQKLRALCVEHGLRFQAIDLRWGVTEESRRNNRTMSVCLRELRRCQAGEVRPDFLILLGDRYGWLPRPEAIPPEVFEVLVPRVSPEARSLLETWYRRDDNAVPPCYWLQPRSGATTDPAVWLKTVEQPLMAALKPAVADLAADASVAVDLKTKVAALGIGLSATHHEILYGVLLLPPDQVRQHVHAFVRTIQHSTGDKPHRDFVELRADGTADPEAKAKIHQLRADLAAHLSADNLHPYEVAWREGGQFTEVDLEGFRTKAYATLEQVILSQIARLQSRSAQAQEEQAHQDFGSERRAGFVGREDVLERIAQYLEKPDNKLLAVLSAAGSGKSALMAEAVARARTQHSGALIIERYLGTTPESSKTEVLLRNLLGVLNQAYPPPKPPAEDSSITGSGKSSEDPVPADFNALVKVFQEALKHVTAEKPLIILLDALDQLADGNIARWLPQELPEQVRFVVSAALPASDAPARSPQRQVTRDLEQLVPEANRLSLGKLEPVHGCALLERWLQLAGRTLQPKHRDAVLQAFSVEGNPLWLRMVADQCARLTSWAEVPALPASLPALIGEMLGHLASEQRHGAVLVERALGYLACSRHGLAEDEWLDLLSRDPEVMSDFRRRFPKSPPVDSIPSAVWVAFLGDVIGFLGETEALGAVLFRYYHRCIFEVASERFLATSEVRQQLHRAMADYFTANARGTEGAKPWDSNHARGFAECVYHRIRAGEAAAAWAVFKDFAFLIQKTRLGLLDGVFEDLELLKQDGALRQDQAFRIIESFLREKAHILRRGNEAWPAYKILLQLAVEHADDSPLTLGAEQWLGDGRCDWVWLKRNQRLPHSRVSPCLAVLEGHQNDVKGALELRDGRLLSWAYEDSLRLWDRHSGACLATLEGHSDFVDGAIELRDGRILSWSNDKTLRLWDSAGKAIAVLEGHSGPMGGALELRNGNLLTWAADSLSEPKDTSLRIWTPTGQSVALLEGHSCFGIKALELRTGKILSWATGKPGEGDHTLRIWHPHGDCAAILKGHTAPVCGVVELRNGNFLSWAGGYLSNDHDLRLWNQQGENIGVLKGHFSEVCGALQLRDGRVLSWDGSSHLFWTVEGHCRREADRLGGLMPILVKGALELGDGHLLTWERQDEFRKVDRKPALMQLWNQQHECITMFEGHSGIIKGARGLRNGTFLSWSFDNTMRVWSRDGKCLTEIKSEMNPLCEPLLLRGGQLLTWCKADLRLWEPTSQSNTQSAGHAKSVQGVRQLSDRRFVSWARDKTLRLWDRDGGCAAVFAGHSSEWSEICGTLELGNRRLLSWCDGKAPLRICDFEGRQLAELTGHAYNVKGALELRAGGILTWSEYEKKLRLWNPRGKCVAVLNGHKRSVSGAKELRDGRILSWEQYEDKIRLWSQSGLCTNVLKSGQWHFYADNAIELRDGRILAWNDLYMVIWRPQKEVLVFISKILRWLVNKLRLWMLISARPIAMAPLEGAGVNEVMELSDGRLLGWSKQGALKLWNSAAVLEASLSLEECLQRFPEFRQAYYRDKTRVSLSVLANKHRSGFVRDSSDFGQKGHSIAWHGDSECVARHLESDGRAVFTQENGQVCFLQVHHGNKSITIAELEALTAT